MNLENIGVVGLGSVGRGLTARLIEHGFEVSVYDARMNRVAEAVAMGARAAVLPADAAEAADVVIIAVDDEETAEEVLFDHGGIGETLRAGGYVLDFSRTGAGFRERATARLGSFGITRVDMGNYAAATRFLAA